MSIARVKTVAFIGLTATEIDIQIHIGPGLPIFTIVGLPDKSIGEAKERIRAVFNVLGIGWPPKRITINMSPASLQKEGSHYDLPIAVGLLVAMNIVPADLVENWLILGELSLDGILQRVPGILMAAIHAQELGRILVCPFDSVPEAKLADRTIAIVGLKQLKDLLAYVNGAPLPQNLEECAIESLKYNCDMSDVQGQEVAKRALEIAAAGGLHLLMIGPPGIGKSMLAKRLITILPDLTPKECLEVSMIYSISNKLNDNILKRHRPYRDPHHSASLPALVGGGSKALPGEISLAHNGVLFLDELGQYSKALDGLRESMETGHITIARTQSHITYPARAQVIAAMNPCKCGYFGTSRGCARAPACAQEYQSKVSGPIMDRFDIVLYMNTEDKWQHEKNEETSETIRGRIIKAIEFHTEQFNVPLPKMDIAAMQLTNDAKKILNEYCLKNNQNQRTHAKIAKIARVIANLDRSVQVEKHHMTEAMMYKRNNVSTTK